MNPPRIILLALCTAILALPTTAGRLHAHGAEIEVTLRRDIVIQAKYDSGQPMSDAQVTVYAPDNPAKPWLTGQADAQGGFSFVPDPSIPGSWAIQTRLAGHGAMVHVRLEETHDSGHVAAPVPHTMNNLQSGLMAAAVVWGFIGTALFFSRGRTA